MIGTVLLVGLIALPLFAGGLLLALPRLGGRVGRGVALVAAGGAALCALALIPFSGQGQTPGIEWLPGTGQMTLGMEGTSLAAAGVTALAAAVAMLASPAPHRAGRRASGLILIALGAANAAFLANHFLGRYVALEIVALCVALAPPIELGGGEGVRQSTGAYLLLRLGDVGLLAAIAVLSHAAGTLEIAPALAAGEALDARALAWVGAGLVLAVWVKQGMWPLHAWMRAGQRLSTPARAWLYATVMPNLGVYLLYRVTPLLTLSDPLRGAASWLGAASAALAAGLALTGADLGAELIDLGAAMGGVLLFVAASGVKPVVWLAVPALTLPRLLGGLAGGGAAGKGRASAALLALSGTVTAAFFVLAAGWARAGGAHPGAVWLVHVAAACAAAWAVRVGTWEPAEAQASPLRPAQWAPLALATLLSLALLIPMAPQLSTSGAAGGRVLGSDLLAALGMTLSLPDRAPLAETALSLLAAALLTGGVWVLLARGRERRPRRAWDDLQGGLSRSARVLRNGVEVSLQERLLGRGVRLVMGGAEWLHRLVEQRLLENMVQGAVSGVVWAGKIARRTVERGSLETLLQRVVQGVYAWSRGLQRVHTGRLRANMAWVAAALCVAVAALILWA